MFHFFQVVSLSFFLLSENDVISTVSKRNVLSLLLYSLWLAKVVPPTTLSVNSNPLTADEQRFCVEIMKGFLSGSLKDPVAEGKSCLLSSSQIQISTPASKPFSLFSFAAFRSPLASLMIALLRKRLSSTASHRLPMAFPQFTTVSSNIGYL